MEVYTIGYEGRSINGFVEALSAAGVDVLVDVRMNAISRKRGFSKTALRHAVEAAGIDYDHRREFGNPTENRRSATSVEDCLERYAKTMDGRWQELLGALRKDHDARRIALLCYEANHEECHRGIVAAKLRDELQTQATHL